MANSMISNGYFSAKLAIIVLWITCTSYKSDGVPVTTAPITSCKVDQHPCRHYKALFTHDLQRAITFNGNKMELKNSTRHFVSVYDLMYSSAADTSMDAQLKPNWKTIGGKYIAVNTDGHLTLQEENSTRFLSYYPSKKIENFETFFLCAINGSKSYLVPSRKTSSTRDTPIVWNAEACEKEETFQKKLQTLIQEKLHLYRFGGVSIMETNFDDDNMPVSLSTELKHLCMLKCNSNSAIEISPQ